jgi:hypothetical protein
MDYHAIGVPICKKSVIGNFKRFFTFGISAAASGKTKYTANKH